MNGQIQRKVGSTFNLQFEPGVRERAEGYVARENQRIAPGRLYLTHLINAALVEYLDQHDLSREERVA